MSAKQDPGEAPASAAWFPTPKIRVFSKGKRHKPQRFAIRGGIKGDESKCLNMYGKAHLGMGRRLLR